MNKKLAFKQRARILVAIFAGSILSSGVVLAGAMTLASAMFLAAGDPLPWSMMWVIWFCGLAFWIGGMAPVWKYVNSAGIAALGIGIFILTLLNDLGGSTAKPPVETGYYSICLPLLVGILLLATFLTYAVNFVGLGEDEPNEEGEAIPTSQPDLAVS